MSEQPVFTGPMRAELDRVGVLRFSERVPVDPMLGPLFVLQCIIVVKGILGVLAMIGTGVFIAAAEGEPAYAAIGLAPALVVGLLFRLAYASIDRWERRRTARRPLGRIVELGHHGIRIVAQPPRPDATGAALVPPRSFDWIAWRDLAAVTSSRGTLQLAFTRGVDPVRIELPGAYARIVAALVSELDEGATVQMPMLAAGARS